MDSSASQAADCGDTRIEKLFTSIHDSGIWKGGDPSTPLSGPGSALSEAIVFFTELDSIVKTHDISSIVDLGCGDLTWMNAWRALYAANAVMSTGKPTEIRYTGVDIVKPLIDKHRVAAGGDYLHGDLRSMSLPAADLFILKEVLCHHTDEDAIAVLRNICRSDFKWLLVTTAGPDVGPCRHNVGQAGGFHEPWHWRTTDLTLPPISLRHYQRKFTLGRFTFLLVDRPSLAQSLRAALYLKQVAPKGVSDARTGSRVLYYDGPFVAANPRRPWASASSHSKIPWLLHLVCLGGSAAGDKHADSLRAVWEAILGTPSWRVVVWRDDDLRRSLPQHVLEAMGRCASRERSAHLAGLAILEAQGGWCFAGTLLPIESISALASELAWAEAIGCNCGEWNPDSISCGVLASRSAHPWISDALLRGCAASGSPDWDEEKSLADALRADMEGVLFLPSDFFYGQGAGPGKVTRSYTWTATPRGKPLEG